MTKFYPQFNFYDNQDNQCLDYLLNGRLMTVHPESTLSPRIREKRERRQAEILHAALVAFRAKGYHSTTLEDIAERLDVRKTALYHYFPDKESILYACHRESLGEVRRILHTARTRYHRAPDQLAFAIREHVRVMTQTLEGSPLAFEVTALSSEHQAEVITARDAYEQGLRDIVVRGIDAGDFRPCDPKVAVFVVLGAINWIARWYRPDGSMQVQELGNQFADLLVGGLTCQ